MITVEQKDISQILSFCDAVSAGFTEKGEPAMLRPLYSYCEIKVEEDRRLKLSVQRDIISGYFYHTPKQVTNDEIGKSFIVGTAEFQKLISSRYNGDITFEADEEKVVVKQGSFSAKIPLYRKEKFPVLDFSQMEFRKFPEEASYILWGYSKVGNEDKILFDIGDDGTNLFTNTTNSLFIGGIDLKGAEGRKVLAKDCVDILLKCFEEEKEVEIGFNGNQVILKADIGYLGFTLLYDGMYKDYKAMTAWDDEKVVTVNRESLVFVLDSISNVLPKWEERIVATLMCADKLMNLKAVNSDNNAEANETIKIETALTEDFKVGFPIYSMKFLKWLTDENVMIYVKDNIIFMMGTDKRFSMGFLAFNV
jgi:DNA polymerase III sliding clamp (beta) subunit (PCNA family)